MHRKIQAEQQNTKKRAGAEGSNVMDLTGENSDDEVAGNPNKKLCRTKSVKTSRKLDGQKRLACAVCFDEFKNSEGFSCPQHCGTFTCWDCLQQSYTMASVPGAIQGNSNAGGDLLCSDIKCRSPIKVLDLARSNASETVINVLEDFKLHVHTTKRVNDALRLQEN